MDKNGEIKCFYALCQCHYPPTSSHHLVRRPRNIQNNMLKVSAFSFVQRRNNSHKRVSLPKEKFPCRAGVMVSWLGPGVQDSSLKAGRWNIKKLCNATGQVLLNRLGLRRWIIFFFLLLCKTVFGVKHFIPADSIRTWSFPIHSLGNIKYVGISPSLSIWINLKGFV